MPTLHVTPDGHENLQVIADALCKARKVVVITGAGISTNSGIPDFRSENGLYSLIQAQFDRASSNSASQPAAVAESPDAASSTTSPPSIDTTPDREADLDQGRSIKRRKLSPEPTAERDEPPTELQEDAQPDEGQHSILSNSGSPKSAPEDPAEDLPSQVVEAPPPPQPGASALPPIRDLRARQTTSPLSSPPPGLFDPFRRQSLSPTASIISSEPSEDDETPPSSAPMSQSASSHTMQNLPNMKGKDLFDVSIWRDPMRTSVFYTFTTSLRRKVKSAEPTNTHHFLGHLRDRGKLVRCYTQNIDEIEEKVGLTTCLKLGPGHRGRFSTRAHRASAPAALNRTMSDPGAIEAPREKHSSGVECVYLHGSLSSLRCFACGRISEWEDERESETMCGRQPACPHCVGATAAREGRGKRALGVGKLRPNIVLYGEEHPNAHLIAPVVQHDLSLNPDMLLILGTSLRVHGLKVMVREFAKTIHSRNGMVVFVNLTKPAESAWADIIDYWVQWDCDAWVNDLKAKKPIMWLPPGSDLPEPEKQRKETKPKTSKPSGAPKNKQPKASGSRKSKGSVSPPTAEGSETIVAEQDTSFEIQSTTDAHVPQDGLLSERQDAKKPGRSDRPRQPKQPKPPRVRLPQLQDDKSNTAFLLATLEASLAKIGRRRNNYHTSMRHPLSLGAIRKLSTRSSDLAGETAAASFPTSIASDGHDWVSTPTPLHKTIKKTSTKRKSQAKPKPSLINATRPTQAEQNHDPPPASTTWRVKSEDAKPPRVSNVFPSDEAGDSSGNSIAAAIKSNPRKRKPKVIDGCEIIVPGARRSVAPIQPPAAPPAQSNPSSEPGTNAMKPVVSGTLATGDSGAHTTLDASLIVPTAGNGFHDRAQSGDQEPSVNVSSAGQDSASGSNIILLDAHNGVAGPPTPRHLFSASGHAPAPRLSLASSPDAPAMYTPSKLTPCDGGQEVCHGRTRAEREAPATEPGSVWLPPPRVTAGDSPTIPRWLLGQHRGGGGGDRGWKAPATYTPLSFPPAPISRHSPQAFQLTQPLLLGHGSEPRFALIREPPRHSSLLSEHDRAAEAAIALTSMKAIRP
ncbi:hypothetical protein MAPG_01525 [Magnaporthiopsis poae ATCC 64411]|uniref:Deacetylase sirtuin-type domain-containing protein n=1 Tax=Magnaporthiopsis poae (strain ATCC 64411 / 73-15) TaxID=644358 RepID=A0A0C4DNX6_MAGP6|nr:hypothetical protein MAPG_01525 [Magnaporthiopsis poae ATCC 64411]